MNALALDNAEGIRAYVLENLGGLGFPINEGEILHENLSKDTVRSLHSLHRAEFLRKNAELVDRYLDDIAPFFADGVEIDPCKIDPFIRPVLTELDGALFRAATMLWSVPVSQGYGRRNRFLVCDRQNGALIGVFALGDPVFNLAVRDRLIGWDARDREHRLYQCFDAFVLGAVPPYRELLGGKAVALCAISNETRRFLEKKYAGVVTKIREQEKPSTPVLITTTSALGRSSIYNRIKLGKRTLFYSVGYTEGFGHFHIPEQLFAAFVAYLDSIGSLPGNSYGSGPNYRMRVTRTALTELGLNPELMRHGVRREVFLAPVAHNWREVLRGEETEVDRMDLPLAYLGEFYAARWAFPRSMRDASYKTVTNASTLSAIRPAMGITPTMLSSRRAREVAISSFRFNELPSAP